MRNSAIALLLLMDAANQAKLGTMTRAVNAATNNTRGDESALFMSASRSLSTMNHPNANIHCYTIYVPFTLRIDHVGPIVCGFPHIVGAS